MPAELIKVNFLKEFPPIGDNFWLEPISQLATRVNVKKTLKETGCSSVMVLVIPSFRRQVIGGGK